MIINSDGQIGPLPVLRERKRTRKYLLLAAFLLLTGVGVCCGWFVLWALGGPGGWV
jgi:hypothetical protein